MGLRITRDPEEFAADVGDFLTERPERNVLATILHMLRVRGAIGHEEPLFAWVADPATQATIAAALRTPPRPLIATGFTRTGPASARELMTAWLRHDSAPPGVSAEPDAAQAIADAYTELTGGQAELDVDEALHVLTEVTPPTHPAPGDLRRAEPADDDLLTSWERNFAVETGFGAEDLANARARVERRRAAGFQYLWITPDGIPASTACHNQPIAGTARIGPVYTPPEHRGHGYAGAAVAALSQILLGAGARQCMLLTDLANPTANRIYASIGYVRFGSWQERRFLPPVKLRN